MPLDQQVNKAKKFCPASNRQRIIALLICLGVVLYFTAFALAAYTNVNLGRYLGYCGFKQRTNLPCPTCGMTTATIAFAQGRIIQAFNIHPAAGLLYSLAVVAAILALFVAISGIYPKFIKRFFAEIKIRHVILALVIVLAAGWAVTLARALAAQS
jgi:hypothetical protein